MYILTAILSTITNLQLHGRQALSVIDSSQFVDTSLPKTVYNVTKS